MRALPEPVRHVLLAAGFFVLALAAGVLGAVADAHQLPALGHLAVILMGAALGLVMAMAGRAYLSGFRGPRFALQVTAMVRAVDGGQQVSGRFQAALRELGPGSPPAAAGLMPPWYRQDRELAARWKRGRVVITARSVTWVRRITGRAIDLTGAQCTGRRHLDPGYKDMTLTLPGVYNGEILAVITLHAHGTDMELAAPVQLLEILRYSLAETTPGARQAPAGVSDTGDRVPARRTQTVTCPNGRRGPSARIAESVSVAVVLCVAIAGCRSSIRV